ncbi:haloacid dehalogenase-like hydrolase [Planoprotostelium fungivorum]|uniref:Haloacid dehalogenase-like hydrolase n=1 Tax=Planoprotostelium fungivorum TaxID=1890364 RepID=A0A2P6NHN4_9EUKA|nr:haloacid dehalogenase-like hydrolase [Planoprotostelium fungivorum]
MDPLPSNFTADNIKLVVTDVDGTLLGPDHQLSDRTARVLNALPSHVRFMLATGKTKWSTRDIYKRVDRLQDNPSIFLNGLFVVHPDGTPVFQTTLSPKIVLEMLDYSTSGADRFVILYCGERIVGSSFNWVQHLADLTQLYHEPICEKIEHEDLKKMIQDTSLAVHKMIFLTEKDSGVEVVRQDLRQRFEGTEMSGAYDSVQAVPQMLEIVPMGTSKAVALENICRELNLSPDQAIAFGDGENDITMLKLAGCSVAVGNAKPFVKSVAKYVGKSNGEDGLADVLSRIFSINPTNPFRTRKLFVPRCFDALYENYIRLNGRNVL